MKTLIYLLFALVMLSGCEKKNEDLVTPVLDQDFPQILLLSDEGDGELEDEDKFSFKITLADRVDPTGIEIGGKVVPLEKDVTVNFEVSSFKGFTKVSDYLLDAKAFYEIDDCSTSEDEGIDLKLVFDKNTGKGSVTFPKGVEEIEIEFETNDGLFDDKIFNTSSRNLEFKLTSVNADGAKVVVNDQNTFEYQILDDDGIYGEYELDITNQAQFDNYIKLFGLVDDRIKGLTVADVKEILIDFQYGEFKAIVVLNKTHNVAECGEVSVENIEFEIEGDLDKLDDDKLSGDVEIVGAIEQKSGAEKEFTYAGGFKLVNGELALTLEGEFDDDKTDEITLNFSK